MTGRLCRVTATPASFAEAGVSSGKGNTERLPPVSKIAYCTVVISSTSFCRRGKTLVLDVDLSSIPENVDRLIVRFAEENRYEEG